MFDKSYYDITEEELQQYRDSLVIEPPDITLEAWDGESFNGLDVELIKKEIGEAFNLCKENGKILFTTTSNTVDNYIQSRIEEEKDHLCEMYFAERLFPVDENVNPIRPQEPTEQELIQAELLLSQQEILINQHLQDEALAAILLSQQA